MQHPNRPQFLCRASGKALNQLLESAFIRKRITLRASTRKILAILIASLAGFLTSSAAQGSITIVQTRTRSVTFANGTYDVLDWTLTAMTGADASVGFAGQDAEIFLMAGTFTVSGGSGTPSMAAIGTLDGHYESFLTTPGAADGGPGSLHSSFVNLRSDIDPTIVENGVPSSTSGSASSISDTWYSIPMPAAGPAGGVEPGQDPNDLTIAHGGSDPFATPGLLAEFLVNPGANISFNGVYSDYGGNSVGYPLSVPEPVGTTTMLMLSSGIHLLLKRRRSRNISSRACW